MWRLALEVENSAVAEATVDLLTRLYCKLAPGVELDVNVIQRYESQSVISMSCVFFLEGTFGFKSHPSAWCVLTVLFACVCVIREFVGQCTATLEKSLKQKRWQACARCLMIIERLLSLSDASGTHV